MTCPLCSSLVVALLISLVHHAESTSGAINSAPS